LKVFVGDIAKREIGGIALAEKVSEVAVDLTLRAMELEIEAALGVRDGGDIEEKSFPLEAGTPDETFETNIEISAGVGK